ncbi:MAG: heme-binding domain-containing protein [Pyrinomonadaceae bacterium]
MRKFFKLTALAAAMLLASVQFVRPVKTNPPIDPTRTMNAHVLVTPEVEAIFARSCQDCHSHQTEWPWYSQIAPASWFVADHVNHGRKEMNFSAWSNYDREHADFLLSNICRTVKHGMMPLSSYTMLHNSAKLSPRDVQTLCAWSQVERARLASR